MNSQPDVILSVWLFPTEQGGRKSKTPKDKFNCMFKIRNEYHDCRLLLETVGALSPGQAATVAAKLLRPDLLQNRLRTGEEVTLCEGHHEIGKARVIEVSMQPCNQT